mmetsp:Transcript_4169/g.10558  ORF Transcript_4169/g.10558 Transcript_4169/m.10558 type:complete len:222 (+) Transcript_4169:791-1456(+)
MSDDREVHSEDVLQIDSSSSLNSDMGSTPLSADGQFLIASATDNTSESHISDDSEFRFDCTFTLGITSADMASGDSIGAAYKASPVLSSNCCSPSMVAGAVPVAIVAKFSSPSPRYCRRKVASSSDSGDGARQRTIVSPESVNLSSKVWQFPKKLSMPSAFLIAFQSPAFLTSYFCADARFRSHSRRALNQLRPVLFPSRAFSLSTSLRSAVAFDSNRTLS